MMQACSTPNEKGFPICGEYSVGFVDSGHKNWCPPHYAARVRINKRRAKNKVGRRQRQRTR